MVDKVVSVITTAFMITALGIALRPGAPTAAVIKAVGSSVAQIQTAAFGPSKK